MSEPLNRRKFLQAAVPLIAAPAILFNRNLLAAPLEKSVVANPPLEILYDTLGNATDGWGWLGQPIYNTTVVDRLGVSYNVSTSFIGTLNSPKTLRKFEVAVGAFDTGNNSCQTPSVFNEFHLNVWRSDLGNFYSNPLTGSLFNPIIAPTIGSTSIPIGNDGICDVFLIGWDLNVPLPSGIEIEIGYHVRTAEPTLKIGTSGSTFPGRNMRYGRSNGIQGEIGQPMASRITVSDVVTAAACEVSGRVVNQSGRGIHRAKLTLRNAQTGETLSTLSNSFGYFRFAEQAAGSFCILSVNAKGYTFQPNSQAFQVLEDVSGIIFQGG